MYIDVHCHLTDEEYDALGGASQVVKDAKAQGVERIVCSGYDLSSSLRAKALAEANDGVYFCAGFHPGELKKYVDGDLQRLRELCLHEKCVAVGEIGLDYHFEDNPPKAQQREMFVRQLALADELGLPVVLHSRDAAAETLEILRQNASLLKKSGLLHCYSYSAEMVDEFAKLGLYFSFGGTSTFKNAKKVWESVKRVPVERILSETDCPYLTPVPLRGEFPNQPKNVRYVAARLAELKEMDENELCDRIEQNARALFFKLR